MPAGDYNFRPPPSAISDALEKVVRELADARADAEDKLTEQQFVEALRQALACGDFVRHVRAYPGEGQCVTYIPYREHEQLKARIRELEARLDAAEKGWRELEERGGPWEQEARRYTPGDEWVALD